MIKKMTMFAFSQPLYVLNRERDDIEHCYLLTAMSIASH